MYIYIIYLDLTSCSSLSHYCYNLKKIKLFSNHKNRQFFLSSGHVQIIMNNLLAVILESKY